MLTTVQLDGVMGRKFGKRWEFEVNSAAEALRMIEANKPGLKAWIVQNAKKFDAYQVTCEYENGKIEELSESDYAITRKIKKIRFTPVVSGSGGGGGGLFKVIVGVAIIVVNFFTFNNPQAYAIGAAMILGGVVEMLSPQPKGNNRAKSSEDWVNSNYFDGPANTELQGSPVPLIYGRVLVGSHPVSASISVDEVAT